MPKKGAQKVLIAYDAGSDSLTYWLERFLEDEIHGLRSKGVEQKIKKQIERFIEYFRNELGHDRISAATKRVVRKWLDDLYDNGAGFAAATVNNHKAHLSLFMGWLNEKVPHLLPEDPTKGKGLKDIQLPAPDVRALSEPQLRSLINLLDRLERFYIMKGRKWSNDPRPPIRKNARPKRNRAIVYLFLASGIRREMMINIDIDQLEPNEPDALRAARRFRIKRVRGKGRTETNKIIVDQDTREALADYLEYERPLDAKPGSRALFLNGQGEDGDDRLNVSRVNKIVRHIGNLHDAEQQDPYRKLSPLTPHRFRHTYAVYLSIRTGGNRLVLQQELSHANDRYLTTYTNLPEELREEYQPNNGELK
ncbi:tyrosine-type recombinase/integrase [Paenibacillus sp. LHD-117]|uniref:tyrosine-type recombinase/integrase n=1 Tax=Paenibacillus sp. LHD-117 TaxID=3071412 RepID=UPI0027DFB509|nr:tyrosine-type recombinase/integrase [Paenibacillus sp. LHD-117]MDQ6422603.1 tyrosine-type recombinase/integrase [Paenibacillus sp. LHD-117]